MRKLWACIKKDFKLALQDKVGLGLLFLMPLILTLVMIALQDSSFEELKEQKIPLLIVNEDKDILGNTLADSLDRSPFFHVIKEKNGKNIHAREAEEWVSEGRYQMAIIIPAQTTQSLKAKTLSIIKKQLPEGSFQADIPDRIISDKITVLYDPTTKNSFKQATNASLLAFTQKVENILLFKTYAHVLAGMTQKEVLDTGLEENILKLEERYASTLIHEPGMFIIPNSVQHNIPAWALFAMFFICIPIAGNIIAERDTGIFKRLKCLPVSDTVLIIGKLLVHMVLCFLMAVVLFIFGKYIMPLLGFHSLRINQNLFSVITFTWICAFSATGFGYLIGVISRTFSQAGVLGSISTMILAALGGLWVPIYVMPQFMRNVSKLSPLNWGMEGYYDLFLRKTNLTDVSLPALKLLIFATCCLTLAIYLQKRKTII